MAHQCPPEQQQVIDRVKREGHPQVLRWLGELSGEERASFLRQLSALDFDRMRELAALLDRPPQKPPFSDLEQAPVARLPGKKGYCAECAVSGIGRRVLREDRVAALTVAGGHGTRLRHNAPKGTYPIMPVTKKSLFQVHAEKILAARRRYECRMPWLIMTGPSNDAETRAFFRQKDFFRLGADSVQFFVQQTNPILDARGRLLLAQKGRLLVGPDGHGGVFEAMTRSGLLAMLSRQGLDLISYFQVDNPLVTVADERFLGHHVRDGAEFSCKVLAKRDPGEGLGVAALRSGRPVIVEYTDLPAELARESLASGELKHLYGSIAIHVINVDFAERMGEDAAGLPWHLARKHYDVINENGDRVLSDSPCCKFERFVFDCMAHACACVFLEAERETEFAPIKNAEGPDSPTSSRAAMRRMWLAWLKQAEADVSAFEDPAAELEIGPLFATDAGELKKNLPPHWRPEPPVVLDRGAGASEQHEVGTSL